MSLTDPCVREDRHLPFRSNPCPCARYIARRDEGGPTGSSSWPRSRSHQRSRFSYHSQHSTSNCGAGACGPWHRYLHASLCSPARPCLPSHKFSESLERCSAPTTTAQAIRTGALISGRLNAAQSPSPPPTVHASIGPVLGPTHAGGRLPTDPFPLAASGPDTPRVPQPPHCAHRHVQRYSDISEAVPILPPLRLRTIWAGPLVSRQKPLSVLSALGPAQQVARSPVAAPPLKRGRGGGGGRGKRGYSGRMRRKHDIIIHQVVNIPR